MISWKLAYERFPLSLTANIIKKPASAVIKRFVTINSRHYLTQTKYNLIREESTGYSLLVVLLNSAFGKDIKTHDIIDLIGTYNLDPNRVIDFTLQAYSFNLAEDEFITLLEALPCNHIPHVIGLYLISKDSSEMPKGIYSDEKPLKRLFAMIAKLIKHGIVSMEQLYPYFSPDDEIIDHFENRLFESTKIRKTKKGIEDWYELDKSTTQLFLKAHKFLLLEALLDPELDDWEHASILLDTISDLNPCSYPPIAQRIASILHDKVDKVYQLIPKFPKKEDEVQPHNTEEEIESFISSVQELLIDSYYYFKLLNVQISMNTPLFVKLCRLFTYSIKKIRLLRQTKVNTAIESMDIESEKLGTELLVIIDWMVENTLLPALTLIRNSYASCIELWALLKLYNHTDRFRMYYKWQTDDSIVEPNIKKVEALVQVRADLKRVTDTNVKCISRKIGLLSHSSPTIVMYEVLDQLKNYPNLIKLLAESLKYMSYLAHDVMMFSAIQILSLPNSIINFDKMQTHVGVVNSLSYFLSIMINTHKKMSLLPLLEYVDNQMRGNGCNYLIILKDILNHVACIKTLDDSNQKILEHIYMKHLDVSQTDSATNISALTKPLIDTRIWLPIFILLAQKELMLTSSISNLSHLRLVSDQYDRTHELVVLYSAFIKDHILHEYKKDIKRLMTIKELVSTYDIHATLVLSLYRPIISLLYSEESNDATSSGHEPEFLKEIGEIYANQTKLLQPRFMASFWRYDLFDIVYSKEAYQGLRKPPVNVKIKDGVEKSHDEHVLSVLNSCRDERLSWFECSESAAVEELLKIRLETVSDGEEEPMEKEDEETIETNKNLDEIKNEKDLGVDKNDIQDNAIEETSVHMELNEEPVEEEKTEEDDSNLKKEDVGDLHVENGEKETLLIEEANKKEDSEVEQMPTEEVISHYTTPLDDPQSCSLAMEILQVCIIPRVLYSSEDALYCFNFVKLLHEVCPPKWNTLSFYKVLFSMVSTILTSISHDESARFGRFLRECLHQLYIWYQEPQKWFRDFKNHPSAIVYKDFKKIRCEWENNLRKDIVALLKGEHFYIKNAFMTLIKLVDVFPTYLHFFEIIRRHVEKLSSDSRPDIKSLATITLGSLKAQKERMLLDQEFEKDHPAFLNAVRERVRKLLEKRSQEAQLKKEQEKQQQEALALEAPIESSVKEVAKETGESIDDSNKKESKDKEEVVERVESIKETKGSNDNDTSHSEHDKDKQDKDEPRISRNIKRKRDDDFEETNKREKSEDRSVPRRGERIRREDDLGESHRREKSQERSAPRRFERSRSDEDLDQSNKRERSQERNAPRRFERNRSDDNLDESSRRERSQERNAPRRYERIRRDDDADDMNRRDKFDDRGPMRRSDRIRKDDRRDYQDDRSMDRKSDRRDRRDRRDDDSRRYNNRRDRRRDGDVRRRH